MAQVGERSFSFRTDALSFDPQQFSIWALLIAYRGLLDLSYWDLIGTVYKHNDYIPDPQVPQLLESYLFLFIPFVFLPKRTEKFSALGLQLLFIIAFVPISSFFGMGEGGRLWFYTCTSFIFLLLFLTHLLCGRGEDLPVRTHLPFQKSDLVYALLLLPLFTVLAVSYEHGFFFNLDLLSVYEIRERFDEVRSSIPLGGYIMNWAGKVSMPFLLLFSLFGRQRFHPLLFAASFLLLISLFSLAGHKSYLFIPFMAAGLAVLIRRPLFLRDLLGCLVLVVGGCLLYFQIFGDPLPGSIFIRRFFFVPAKLSWYYHELFTVDLLHLSHSIFEGIFPYPLEMPHTNHVAKEFLGKDLNANNGVFSDGLKNFGIVGMYLWALLIAFLFKVGDRVTAGKDRAVLWSLLGVGIYTLINGAFFPTLLTHGVLVMLLIAFLYPMNTYHESIESRS